MNKRTKAILAGHALALWLTTSGCQLLLPAGQNRTEGAAKSGNSNNHAPAGESAAAPAENRNAAKPAASSLPAAQELNLQANHPNGAVLRVTKVSYSDDHIALAISVTNGHKEEIKLNGYNDLILRDNIGNRYNLAPPPQNPEVRVQSGSSLNGTFNFLGRINPAANSLTLTTNDKFGSDNDFSRTPKMTIDNIPVQRAAS